MKEDRQDLPIIPKDYHETLTAIKKRIRSSQTRAIRTLNQSIINLYWDIGKIIVERQCKDKKSWGKSVVERLSGDLQNEFSGQMGFSPRNIWRMRNFYLTYSDSEILPRLVAEIPWGHNSVILDKCKNPLQREFYIRLTRKQQWKREELVHKITNRLYEQTITNQTNFLSTLPEGIDLEAKLAFKDEYTFEFLEMKSQYTEHQLESAILQNIPSFLREMGGKLAFAGNQFRLQIDGREFFIDLLLYHIKLRCFIAIELKTTEFKPEYVGKMLFYLSALEKEVCEKGDNPPIGIILCRSKNRTFVEYTLKKAHAPIGVSKYSTINSLPEDLKHLLPSKEQITILLEGLGK